MKKRCLAMALCVLVLTGCTSILERTYSSVEPHSSKFWESEAADTLRAENYQDIVNDLLLLIGEHRETAVIRLYAMESDLAVAETLERATVEIQQETPLGAYAVEYITSTSEAQRGYHEIQVQISYRRTAEQIRAIVNATSAEAVYSLLENALRNDQTELAIRIGYWNEHSRALVEEAVARLRADCYLPEETSWLVQYYPAEGPVGLVEVLLKPTEEQLKAAAAQQMEETQEAETSEEAVEQEGIEGAEGETQKPDEAEIENQAVQVNEKMANIAPSEEKEKN